MNLLHIKLKNGEDILGQEDISFVDDGVTIISPISVHLDPINGFFAKSWMVLSDVKTVHIKQADIMYCYPASATGREYYDEFIKRMSRDAPFRSSSTTDEDIEDLEQMFEAMLQSKASIKH